MQSKKASVVESVLNVISGFIVGVVTQLIIFPWFDIHNLSIEQNIVITSIFSFNSLIRGYCIRRAFNKWALHVTRKAAALDSASASR